MPASEQYPWTDEQVAAVHAAIHTRLDVAELFDFADIREFLRGLHESGFEVRFPRYWTHQNYKGQWFVVRGDGTGEGDHVACFEPSHPSPRIAAEAETKRLNGAES